MEIWQRQNPINYTVLIDKFYAINSLHFVNMIENDEPFSYVRYGDLEWRIILNNRGGQEQKYEEELKIALENLLKNNTLAADNSFYVSFSEKLYKTTHVHNNSINFITTNNVPHQFVDFDVFNHMIRYEPTKYEDFIEVTLPTKKIIFIGNQLMGNLSFINMFKHIVVPTHCCFTEYDNVKNEIITTINENLGQNLLFIFCAGALSPVIIADLHTTYKNQTYSFVDMGSSFDFFVGYASRTPTVFFKETLFQNFHHCFPPEITSTADIVDKSISEDYYDNEIIPSGDGNTPTGSGDVPTGDSPADAGPTGSGDVPTGDSPADASPTGDSSNDGHIHDHTIGINIGDTTSDNIVINNATVDNPSCNNC